MAANTITIQSEHTINIFTDISADQLVVESGAILNHASNATFMLNDNIGDAYDMIINGTYVTNGAIPTGAGSYVVENGGVIRADANNGTNADDLAFSSNSRVLFKTGSAFEWNNTSQFGANGVTYFNSDTERQIFKFSKSIGLPSSTSFFCKTVLISKIEST